MPSIGRPVRHRTAAKLREMYHQREDTIKQNLSARFWDYREQSLTENPAWDNHFCCPDSDVLICAQDYNLEDWYPRRSMRIITIKQDMAIMTASKIGKNQLSISLKPENGSWKIDSARRLIH